MSTKFDPEAFAGGLERSFSEMYPTVAYMRTINPLSMAGYEKVLDLARKFRRLHIDPQALYFDRESFKDRTFYPAEIMEEACKYHFFTNGIPKMFGGQGYSFGSLSVAIEELAAGCLGVSNLVGVHYLALCTVAATFDLEKMEKIARIVVEGERKGKPAFLSTAITEPAAGSDVEDEDEIPRAKITSEATPVKGGYKLNGRKVFISNGSLADYHVTIMPTDKKRALETFACFLVPKETEGFSVGRIEKKMGQKLCPAAELIFEDCFVPESARIGKGSLLPDAVRLVLGATRGGVGAMGAGVARGAYERALKYAATHKVNGRFLIDEQWVMFKLVEMQRNVMAARAAYMEAVITNEMFGLGSVNSSAALQAFDRLIPSVVFEREQVKKALRAPWIRESMEKKGKSIPPELMMRASAFGDNAKVMGSDLGMINCNLALDIMGQDGLRHDRGMEKLFRDGKLLQIYEGTNQLNRIDIFKCIVKPAAQVDRAGD